MPYCKKCGAEYVEGAKYCIKCGAPVSEEWRFPREECFGEKREERDFLGLVSFGFFLLIVGYIFLANQWIPSEIQALFEELGKGAFVPSSQLRYVFALFLGLIGVSNFFMAGIRVAFRQSWRRPLRDALSGVGLISIAYLVYLNSQRLMTWQIVVVLGIVIVGILVILYGIIVSYFKESLEVKTSK
ncbi:MAG: zinc-ribbon domain-containing protein [archaeon]|nr:zinc-ribbon domain-containing protein [archaeon]